MSEEELPNFHISRKLARHVTHKIDRLTKVIFLNNFQISFEGNINPIYQHIKELRFKEPSLSGKSWQNISEEFSSYIENFNFNTFTLKEEGARKELEDLLKSKLSELYDKELRKLSLVSVQELKEREREIKEYKQEREREIEKYKQEREENKQELERTKQENAELKRKLGQSGKSSPYSEQPSPSAEPHSSTPPLHSEKSPSLNSSSPITFLGKMETADEPKEKKE